MTKVTQLLLQIEQGDAKAGEELLPLLYDELRKLAAGHIQREKPGHTLQPTALVHEAYLRVTKTGDHPSLRLFGSSVFVFLNGHFLTTVIMVITISKTGGTVEERDPASALTSLIAFLIREFSF